tara:strand:+ start:1548 stop:1946 length:399 start_codon:yes stop_codon:yes gene_type:complete
VRSTKSAIPLRPQIAALGIQKEETMGLLDRLFGRNKKRSQADETLEVMGDAIQFAAEKWTYFIDAFPFKESVSLQEKILTFMTPATEGLKHNFSALQTAPEPIYLIIVAKGVELSGTHSKQEIENALGVPLP